MGSWRINGGGAGSGTPDGEAADFAALAPLAIAGEVGFPELPDWSAAGVAVGSFLAISGRRKGAELKPGASGGASGSAGA